MKEAVLIQPGGTLGDLYVFANVSRETKTQVILADGRRFNKRTGLPVRDPDPFNGPRLALDVNPAQARARNAVQRRRRQRINLCHDIAKTPWADWSNLTTEQLNQVAGWLGLEPVEVSE